jgi:predicted dehydrogenase
MVFDPTAKRAMQLAVTFDIPHICCSFEELVHDLRADT